MKKLIPLLLATLLFSACGHYGPIHTQDTQFTLAENLSECGAPDLSKYEIIEGATGAHSYWEEYETEDGYTVSGAAYNHFSHEFYESFEETGLVDFARELNPGEWKFSPWSEVVLVSEIIEGGHEGREMQVEWYRIDGDIKTLERTSTVAMKKCEDGRYFINDPAEYKPDGVFGLFEVRIWDGEDEKTNTTLWMNF